MTDHRTKLPFSFASYSVDFDRHIERSIRGYRNLIEDCIELSQYFVENGTVVCDIGCATGRTLAAIRTRNQERAPDARYVGIDIEPSFQQHWVKLEGPKIRFLVQDVLAFEDFTELSLATSIFTLQFLPERYRRQVCRKVYEGLLPGGAVHRRREDFRQDAEDARHVDLALPELQASAFFRRGNPGQGEVAARHDEAWPRGRSHPTADGGRLQGGEHRALLAQSPVRCLRLRQAMMASAARHSSCHRAAPSTAISACDLVDLISAGRSRGCVKQFDTDEPMSVDLTLRCRLRWSWGCPSRGNRAR